MRLFRGRNAPNPLNLGTSFLPHKSSCNARIWCKWLNSKLPSYITTLKCHNNDFEREIKNFWNIFAVLSIDYVISVTNLHFVYTELFCEQLATPPMFYWAERNYQHSNKLPKSIQTQFAHAFLSMFKISKASISIVLCLRSTSIKYLTKSKYLIP